MNKDFILRFKSREGQDAAQIRVSHVLEKMIWNIRKQTRELPKFIF